eukprot:7198801-Alexandrium_andersonii.AAC.1
MSASLVGSEMCIRDSLARWSAARRRSPPSKAVAACISPPRGSAGGWLDRQSAMRTMQSRLR